MTSLCERCRDNEPAINDDWCPDCILEVELILAEVEEHKPDFTTNNGEYSISELEVRVTEYEDEYGLPSDALLEMHRQERSPIDLPPSDRHLWLSMYRELLDDRKKWSNF